MLLMDIPYLKHQLNLHQTFFRNLYLNNPRRNTSIIEKATKDELNILIKILYLICKGKISIRNEDFITLKKSKRLNYFKAHFDGVKNFLNTLK